LSNILASLKFFEFLCGYKVQKLGYFVFLLILNAKQNNNAQYRSISRVSFAYLQSQYETKEPRNLYEPIHYILDLGGKRMRPVLT
jgi:hypothetical protein